MATRKTNTGTANGQTVGVAYLRKSQKAKKIRENDGTDKGREEASISRQQETVNELAEFHDATIARFYADDGKSGWKSGKKRPDFTRMLAECQALCATVLFVEDLDRFSRDGLFNLSEDVNKLRRAGVTAIVDKNGRYEIDDDVEGLDGLVLMLRAAQNGSYSAKLGHRVAKSHVRLGKDGKRVGGSAPMGMKIVGEKYQRVLAPGDPAEIKIVRQIFAMYDAGRSVRAIAVDLNARGVPTVRRGDGWQGEQVRRLLRNVAYVGDYVWGRSQLGVFANATKDGVVKVGGVARAIKAGRMEATTKQKTDYRPSFEKAAFHKRDAWEGIIDRRLFDRVQKRLDAESYTRDSGAQRYALTGVLYCGHCGAAMTGYTQTKTGQPVYRCSSERKKGRCQHYSIRQDAVLPFIVRRVARELLELPIRTRLAIHDHAETPALVKLDDLRRRKAESEKKLDRIAEQIMVEDDPKERQRLDRIKAKWRAEDDDLDAQIVDAEQGEAPAESAEDIERFNELLKTLVGVPLPDDLDPNEIERRLSARSPAENPGREPDGLNLSDDGGAIEFNASPAAIRSVLHELGARFDLRFTRETITSRAGKTYTRIEYAGGRFVLGNEEITVRAGLRKQSRRYRSADACR